MNIKRVLQDIIDSENLFRQTGRTTALKAAALSINGKLVCANEGQAKCHRGICYNSIDMIGKTRPLIYDHLTISMIADWALHEIINLETKLSQCKQLIKNMSDVLNE